MIFWIPLALLIYGAITYEKRSKTAQFFIKLGWAILIVGLFGYLYGKFRSP
jgi:hypothetical protein